LKGLTQKALTLNPAMRSYSFSERIYGDYFAAEAVVGNEERHKLLLKISPIIGGGIASKSWSVWRTIRPSFSMI